MQAHGRFQACSFISTRSNPVGYGKKYFFGNYGFTVFIARSITLLTSKPQFEVIDEPLSI